jgi:hemerythrin-like domain-containing protein
VNPIQLLKDDHKLVKKMFREYEKAGEKDYKKKQEIAEQVFLELEVHSKIEEEIFYPAVREQAKPETKKVVAEGVEEHHVVDTLIKELKKLDPKQEEFDAKFKVLTENVEHHIEEEEEEMLPDAERALKKDLEEIGKRMMERKEKLMASASRSR